MRKLNFLKLLVHILLIVTCIALMLALLLALVYMFVSPSILKASFDNVIHMVVFNAPLSFKMIVLLLIGVSFVPVYCLYLFRKTLHFFEERKPFDDFVIKTYNRIGNLLLFSGILAIVLSIAFKLLFLESKRIINLGISPYLMIVCIGLFFMVLSEVFKIAKETKQENDLTI